jgi:uncharacterized membrane protein
MATVAPKLTDSGWWGMMIGLFFLAFILYAASAGSLSKYKAWIF